MPQSDLLILGFGSFAALGGYLFVHKNKHGIMNLIVGIGSLAILAYSVAVICR